MLKDLLDHADREIRRAKLKEIPTEALNERVHIGSEKNTILLSFGAYYGWYHI
jgi:hypothetical protein